MDTNAAKPWELRRRGVLLASGIAAAAAVAAIMAAAATLAAVFRVREPVMTMNGIALGDLLQDDAAPWPAGGGSPRLTVVADVSVTNPNAASLRYRRSETAVYYRGRRVGAAAGPPGTARARGTVRLNVTVDVAVEALLGHPGFLGDLAAGAVAVATATTVRGRVAVLGVVHRRVALEMNCTATVAVADMSIRDQSCLQRVWL